VQDGGGTITKAELGDLMDTLGIEATPEEIDLMITEIDQDSNGEIDFEGKITLCLSFSSCMYNSRTLSLSTRGTFCNRSRLSTNDFSFCSMMLLTMRRICGGHVKEGQRFLYSRSSERCIQSV
jgi:EF-hand domain pair